ncbi:MAG: patatin-like phospholipase family protein [Beutenbergiaceae bacterium]
MSQWGQWLRDAPVLRRNGRQRAMPAKPGRSRPGRNTVGLVVSGGGARSSFQLGALRYLYDQAGITPSVMTGTSAGAIIATILAQYPDHSGQRAALARLESLWLGMDSSADMFTEFEWFARLRAHLPTWRKVLAMRNRSQRGDSEAHPWTPATALEALGTLWEAGRASTDLQTIVRGPSQTRAAFRPGPIVEKLLDPQMFAPDRLAQSSVALRVALVALESGELRFVNNSGEFRDRHDHPLPQLAPVPVADAVRASCAIPGVFPPVLLAGEHYVDGGVRENLPAQIALERLGVTECYAVVASPAGVRPRASFADADMFEIVMRSGSGIMSDELQRDEIAIAQRAGATVIAPRIDVHDLVTIDPGLMAIAIDYGYLRAQDVVKGSGAARQQLTDDLIRLRIQIWQAEEAGFNPENSDAADGGSTVTDLKGRLGALLAGIPDADLPPDAADWSRTWERHRFVIEGTF